MQNLALRCGFLFQLLATLSGCASGTYTGENLLMPWPVPEENWKVDSGRVGTADVKRWSKIETGDEFYVTTVAGIPGTPEEILREAEKVTGCLTFELQVRWEEVRNGFPSTLWFASCRKHDGATSKLALFVTGKDATYAIYRFWTRVPERSEIERWENYLNQARLCDRRANRNAPCPSAPSVNIHVSPDNVLTVRP